MAGQSDNWLINVDLDTSGIQRGLQGVSSMMNALAVPQMGGTGGGGGAAIGSGSMGAIGPVSTAGTGRANARGQMRELISAQGKVAALMASQLAASSRLIGRQVQDLNRFGDLYFDQLKTQIKGFSFFAPQQQAEIERTFIDAFKPKAQELLGQLNKIKIEDISLLFSIRDLSRKLLVFKTIQGCVQVVVDLRDESSQRVRQPVSMLAV